MKYKLQKETKPKLSTFGKYKAVAVHQQAVGTKEIAEEHLAKLPKSSSDTCATATRCVWTG